MSLIFIAAIVAITLFALMGLYLLSTKRGIRFVNAFLGVFFILWALDFLDGLLILNGFYLDHPHLSLLTEPFILFYGPLIYGYTIYTLEPERQPQFKDLLHLIPFVAAVVLLILVYHLRPAAEKVRILQEVVELRQPWEAFWIYLLVYIHFFWYLFLSKRRLKNTEKQIVQYYSTFDLGWLNQLLNALILVLSVSLVSGLFQFSGERVLFEFTLLGILLITGVFIAYLLLKALDKPYVTTGKTIHDKYAQHTLEPDEANSIAQQLVQALEKEKLYLDPELNLHQLSNSIHSSSRKVSQVINEHFGKNFFDLINSHRIEAAKTMLKERKDPKLTILEVMYAVGFNSKSSFNTQFKLKTGLTPTEFLRLHS